MGEEDGQEDVINDARDELQTKEEDHIGATIICKEARYDEYEA